METLELIESVTHYDTKNKKKAPAKNERLAAYANLTPADVKNMLRSMLLARRIEREEKLLLRRGYTRFFIGCGGKELADVAIAQFTTLTDPFIGYYRDKALDIHRDQSLVREKIYEAIGDARGRASGGVSIPAHPAFPELSILPTASSTGSQAMPAMGVACAIKNPTPISTESKYPGGAYPKDAVTVCSIGDGATSSTEYHRAVFNSVQDKAAIVWSILNCGWAISVSVDEQYPDGDPTTQFKGYEKLGLKIYHIDGTDIKDTLKQLPEAIRYTREGNGPVVINFKVTREGSHSGSDDQSFYMHPDEQAWHTENDAILKTCRTLIEDKIVTKDEIAELWDELDKEVSTISAEVLETYQTKTPEGIFSKVSSYDWEKTQATWSKYRSAMKESREDLFKKFHKAGYFSSPEVPEKQGPMTFRHIVNYTLFDIFAMSTDAVMFGEDVADWSGRMIKEKKLRKNMKGKGGVFLMSKHLQDAFGNDRCWNTSLDEAGILGRAIGHCFQGRRPLPEIQFLDYMSPAYQVLKDRIATMNQLSNGQWSLPMVIRTTFGGYKQGAGAFWHSESNMGTWMQMPGLQIVTPSNGRDAALLLRTAWASDDPVLFCESVALYNRHDWEGIPLETEYPEIDELLPFGVGATYLAENTDCAIITYGATVAMSLKVAEIMREKGVGVRVVDLRTLAPLDKDIIRKTAEECGRVVIVTEDRFPGGCGPTISAVITTSEALDSLEAPINIVHAMNARVAYGSDGDDACLPTIDKIATAVSETVNY